MTRSLRLLCIGALLSLPEAALAHSPIKGINNFYNGMLHPLFVPAHLMLILTLGLLYGQQGLKEMQKPVAFFLLTTALGLIAAGFSTGVNLEVALLVCAASIGLLIAISPELSLFWFVTIGVSAGFLIGLDSAQDSLAGKEKMLSLFGSGVAVYFLLIYITAFVDRFQSRSWQKIGVRIVGSWVAASALLVLSLSLSQTQL